MNYYNGIIKYIKLNIKRIYLKYFFDTSRIIHISNVLINNVNINVVKNFISNMTHMRSNKKIDYG